MTSATRQLSWTDFFTVAVRPRTYGNLLYLWLGFPLGLAYFIGLTVGISAGVPLTLIWIGLAILLVTFLAAWGAAGFERQLAMLQALSHTSARTSRSGPPAGSRTAFSPGSARCSPRRRCGRGWRSCSSSSRWPSPPG